MMAIVIPSPRATWCAASTLACASDRYAVDRGLLQVPLLREDGLACSRPDQLGVAVFDVIALEQRLRHIKDFAADALGGLDKERVGGVAHLLLDRQTILAENL